MTTGRLLPPALGAILPRAFIACGDDAAVPAGCGACRAAEIRARKVERKRATLKFTADMDGWTAAGSATMVKKTGRWKVLEKRWKADDGGGHLGFLQPDDRRIARFGGRGRQGRAVSVSAQRHRCPGPAA